jgi:hypothetical protein
MVSGGFAAALADPPPRPLNLDLLASHHFGRTGELCFEMM